MDFEQIRSALAALGVSDADRLARFAIEHDRPMVAETLVLRRIWSQINDVRAGEGLLSGSAAGRRLLDADVESADLLGVATLAAYETVFHLLFALSEGVDVGAPPLFGDAPGVVLMETDGQGVPTGRVLGGLHESLLSADPTGLEGRDFLL